VRKTASASHLNLLRRRAGLPLREAARRLAVLHTKLVYWEKTGKIPNPELVGKVAALYGVSVEEVLGIKDVDDTPRTPGGKLGEVFTAAAKLPRRQQQKIIEFVEPFIRTYERDQAAAHS